MTYYLKYRPQKIDELDIAQVRETLGKIVSSGRIPHAFLFSGPKGTGKTSAARILAKVVNCERKNAPCNQCDTCVSITKGSNIDVLELDAASHRGIDDVRALKDAVKLSPAKAKKKVYIIDEAHMLTTEASNALLKTLEEPPAHVMFILATTNPEKLISTIKSRTVNIPFKKATADEIVRSLGRVVKGEKIKIKPDALTVVAVSSEGSFRDAVKTLEQMVLEKRKLDKEVVEEFLLQRKTMDIEKFVFLLAKKDAKNILEEIERIKNSGGSFENLTKSLLETFRLGLLAKIGIATDQEAHWPGVEELNKEDLIYLIELFSNAAREISDSPIEELPLEIAVIKWCEGGGGKQQQSTHLDQNSLSEEVGTGSPRSHSPASPSETSKLDSTSESLAQTIDPGVRRQVAASKELKEINEEVWKNILAAVRVINTSIEALLRAAKPMDYDGKDLTLGVFYRFHKERLEEGVNRKILEEVVGNILGKQIRVICTLTEPPKKPASPAGGEIPKAPVLTEGEDRDIMKIAEEIFGN